MARSVLPQPAPPHTRVGRPRGSPPLVISSSPGIPVGAFGNARLAGWLPFPAGFGDSRWRRRTVAVMHLRVACGPREATRLGFVMEERRSLLNPRIHTWVYTAGASSCTL